MVAILLVGIFATTGVLSGAAGRMVRKAIIKKVRK